MLYRPSRLQSWRPFLARPTAAPRTARPVRSSCAASRLPLLPLHGVRSVFKFPFIIANHNIKPLGTTFVGSGLQSYGVGALINATGTLSYKGAAYLGSLIFLATSAPTVSSLNSFAARSSLNSFAPFLPPLVVTLANAMRLTSTLPKSSRSVVPLRPSVSLS